MLNNPNAANRCIKGGNRYLFKTRLTLKMMVKNIFALRSLAIAWAIIRSGMLCVLVSILCISLHAQENIRINQLGYHNSAPKIAVVTGKTNLLGFYIVAHPSGD